MAFWKKKQDLKVQLPKDVAVAIVRSLQPTNYYESLRKDPTKAPLKIRHDLTETEMMFRGDDRIRAYAEADRLYDNDNAGSTLETCIRAAVGESGGVPTFTGPNGPSCQKIFNTWKQAAGYAEDENYNDLLKLILRTVKLHGDCLILLDPGLTEGKLRIWDADQICSVNDADFRQWCIDNDAFDIDANGQPVQWRQVEGAVMNNYGRIKGYFVTMQRNMFGVPLDKSFFLPLGLGRRVSYRRKLSQVRGEPLFLPNSDLTNDTRMLIKSEVKASQLASEMSLIHRRGIGGENKALSALSEGLTPEEATADIDISPEDLAALTTAASSQRDFAAFEGKAAIGEIGHDDDIINLSSNRPSPQIQEWMDNLSDQNSKRLGVMSLFGRGRADNSYSSAQVEVSVSWMQFQEDQKLLERSVVDYICSVMFPGEEYTVTWPEAFEVDPQKSEDTKDARWRGGRTSLREMLGPNWKDKVLQLAEEKKFLEANGLTNLSFFQTTSGAVIPEDDDTEEEQ